MNNQNLCIEDFTSPLDYFRAWMAAKKEVQPSFSYAVMAKSTGLSSSALKMMFTGQRPFTLDFCRTFSSYAGLNKSQHNHLLWMILTGVKDFETLGDLGELTFPVGLILALKRHKDFQGDPQWIYDATGGLYSQEELKAGLAAAEAIERSEEAIKIWIPKIEALKALIKWAAFNKDRPKEECRLINITLPVLEEDFREAAELIRMKAEEVARQYMDKVPPDAVNQLMDVKAVISKVIRGPSSIQ